MKKFISAQATGAFFAWQAMCETNVHTDVSMGNLLDEINQIRK